MVKLSDGTLWVHSPLQLDEGLKQALARLGEVRHIVSPNFEHTSFASQVMLMRILPSILPQHSACKLCICSGTQLR